LSSNASLKVIQIVAAYLFSIAADHSQRSAWQERLQATRRVCNFTERRLSATKTGELFDWSSFLAFVDWCGRPESNRHRPFGPTDFRTIYGFRRLAWARARFGSFVVWTIPSP